MSEYILVAFTGIFLYPTLYVMKIEVCVEFKVKHDK